MPEVFVVDDVPRNLEMVMQILTDRGLKVSVAVSGFKALDYLQRRSPDLILLDISMPEMDGFTVCRRIKANPETAAIPIIFLTAKTDTDDVVRGFELGAVDYVRKPFVAEELVSRVFTHLELKRSYEKIAHQARELEEVVAQKDRFFSILAHDLRNPLSGLMNLTAMVSLRRQELDADKMSEYLGLIHNSSARLSKLLENLLAWSRLQLGKMQPAIQPVDVARVVRDSVELFRDNAADKEIEIVSEITTGSTVAADQQMMEAILRNLISNAVKFTASGGTVTITAETNGDPSGGVSISVADTGQGMSPEEVAALFHVGKARSRRGTSGEQGTGLGLLLCRELVTAQNGTLDVVSEPGKGSEFRVSLPVSNAEAGDGGFFHPEN